MEFEEQIWGPGIDQYSRNFNLRPREALEGEDQTSGNSELPLLPDLELLLYSQPFDPGNDDDDATEQSLTRATRIVRNYMAQSRRKVFDTYYGFLCIRHLMQLLCLSVLRETDDLGFLDSLSVNVSWVTLSQAISVRALQKANDTLALDSSLAGLYKTLPFSGFGRDDSGAERDGLFLSRILWADRATFLRLSILGLLPGLSVFLLALLRITPAKSEKNLKHQQCVFVQDLSLRHYLVGSKLDRSVLQHAAMIRGDRKSDWMSMNRVVDQDDSRRIANAYTALLQVSQRDVSNAKLLSVEVIGRLGLFVLTTVRSPTPIAPLQLTALMCTSIEFFWLLLEHRPRISVLDWDDIMYYASCIIALIRSLEKRRIRTDEDKVAFSKALGDADIHSLVGRTLLLVTLEGRMGSRPGGYVDLWGDFLSTALLISQSVAYSSQFTPEHILLARYAWLKVWEQIEVFWGLSASDVDQDPKVRQRVADMYRIWEEIRLVLDDETGLPRKCAYPRCFRPVATKRLLGARWACKQCDDVAYCDRICQRA
ncbi:hypothetical protein FRC09_003789 [Ceratobasidium sp. 395]|nr:hypothetical protein FRC09_003789 [Ceratobasidium sp. 395]